MKIVLIGAGGSGISNLAYILQELWYDNLLAIDGFESQITQALEKNGIKTLIGHWQYQIKPDDIVIYSEAVVNSPEVQSAFQLKLTNQQPLKLRNYFQFLGEMSKYFRTVGFSGTNGKSSSSALAITTAKKLIPQLGIGIVWALIPDFDSKSYYLNQEKKSEFRLLLDAIFTGRQVPYHLIKQRYFFLEACEYKRHFLNLDLEKLAITNIELDHTDYYKDLEDYTSAYLQMIDKTSHEVFVLKNLEQEAILSNPKTKILPVKERKLKYIRWEHTNQNASLVAGVLQSIDPTLSDEQILEAMYEFKGIWRRMEFLTTLPTWAKLYTDYGHIASSLSVGYNMLHQKYPEKKIIALFQPHQMHRVLVGWDDFYPALAQFDQRAIYQIYAARENIQDFAQEPLFQQQHFTSVDELGDYFAKEHNAEYLQNFDQVMTFLGQTTPDDILVVFTAWDLDFLLRKKLWLLK